MQKKKASRLSRGDRVFLFVNKIVLVIVFIMFLYPLLFVISASVSDPEMVNAGKVILLPRGFTLDGYRRILDFSDIWRGYLNTLYYTIVGTVLNLAFTIPCAYAISRKEMAGRNIVMLIIMITMYFSGGLIPIYLNLKSFGLLDTWYVLLITGLVSAYNVVVSRTFFASTIPLELYDAAYIDGAGDWTTFIRIVLPLSKPILAVMALYYGVARWNSYFDAMVYLRDRAKYPLQMYLREVLIQTKMVADSMTQSMDPEAVKELNRQANEANLIKYCVIIVSTAPMMAIYPWLQRFFGKGVMIGSVKG
ncbi:MAG: carbohydrate ABC transporter permease [Clostridia bacterium]|nr:carbohydrate ABC transporter permease [Clostridia bacterium]MBQ4158182.1 carbohydrate ABC transporter permease [Clostridia bacterium]